MKQMVRSEESTSNGEALAIRGRGSRGTQSLKTEEKSKVKEDVQSPRTKINFVGIARETIM
jgi:hypothetical protein